MSLSLKLCAALLALGLLPPARGQSAFSVYLSGSDQGRVFEGIGAVSAGASSRLLADYPEPYRGDILDYLFKPGFGVAFQHLKVEIGGGENSTCGSEPTHANSRAELRDPQARGYELWLMAEARARNPKVILDCLPWTYPAWVKGPFTQDATDWIGAFASLAQRQHTPLDWISAGWNERGSSRDWIVDSLRPMLDARGYGAVQLQAPDDCNRFWEDFDRYGSDEAYQAAVKASGYHYVNGRQPWTLDQAGHPSTEKAKASGKPLWDSEEWSQSGRDWNGVGATFVARVINKMYIRDRVTKTEVWCPIDSIYPSIPWAGTGPMQANSPWSGHYTVWPGVWAIAHTTQFAAPGWRYLDGGCGKISPNTWKGSYVSLQNPATGDWSTIICTDGTAAVSFRIGGGLKRGSVHVWVSNAKEQFVRQADLLPDAGGALQAQLEADAIYSFTTTTGQTKGAPAHPIPPEAPFPFPFHENFGEYVAGKTPRYFSDMKGTFETALDPQKGMCLAQIAPAQGIVWDGAFRVPPYTVFGDPRWSDYKLSADARIAGGQVEIGGRFGSGDLHTLSYRWIVNRAGGWQLVYKGSALASGTLTAFDGAAWHHLELGFQGSHVEGSIDGTKLAGAEDAKSGRGMADLGSSYDRNIFTNVSVTPWLQ